MWAVQTDSKEKRAAEKTMVATRRPGGKSTRKGTVVQIFMSTKSAFVTVHSITDDPASLGWLSKTLGHLDSAVRNILRGGWVYRHSLEGIGAGDAMCCNIANVARVSRQGSRRTRKAGLEEWQGSLPRIHANRYFHFAHTLLRDNALSLFMVTWNSFSKALRSDRV